jgi:hypothetical protein
LFATLTAASRDDKVSFNFGKESFAFELDEKIDVNTIKSLICF